MERIGYLFINLNTNKLLDTFRDMGKRFGVSVATYTFDVVTLVDNKELEDYVNRHNIDIIVLCLDGKGFEGIDMEAYIHNNPDKKIICLERDFIKLSSFLEYIFSREGKV